MRFFMFFSTFKLFILCFCIVLGNEILHIFVELLKYENSKTAIIHLINSCYG